MSEGFKAALGGLERGDFTALDPLLPQIAVWHGEGLFNEHPAALAEALTCACFNGRIDIAQYFLNAGVPVSGGGGTGMNAIHWAANRGQLEAIRLLIRAKANFETRSMHGGNVLDTAIWSAINEPKPDHLTIIEELLQAGARADQDGFPTGDKRIDEILRRH